MIRVTAVDDHAFVLLGIRKVIGLSEDIQLIGEALTANDAYSQIVELAPDIALIDVNMPEKTGFDLAEQLKTNGDRTPLLFVSGYTDVDKIRRAILLGARGYVLQCSSPKLLLDAIRTIHSGGIFADPQIASILWSVEQLPYTATKDSHDLLSLRELEVAKLSGQGMASKEIARRLNISIKTIERHRANAMRKLNLKTRAELISYAADHGWLAIRSELPLEPKK
jgi:DNA-binding NarL/FixJ family response regulator